MASFLRWVGIERRGEPMPEREPDQILTVPEVADLLRVHPSTIYRLLREKKIPAFKVGSDWRFNLSAIDKWRLAQDGQVK